MQSSLGGGIQRTLSVPQTLRRRQSQPFSASYRELLGRRGTPMSSQEGSLLAPPECPLVTRACVDAALARSQDTGLEHCLWGSPSPSLNLGLLTLCAFCPRVPSRPAPGEMATHWLSVGSFRSSGRTLKKSNRCGQREIFTGSPMRPLKYSVSVPWRLSAARCPSNHLGAGWGEPETHEHAHTSPNVYGKGEQRRGPRGRGPC